MHMVISKVVHKKEKYRGKDNDMLLSYHCNENTKFWAHINYISISEGKLLLLLFMCIKNYSYLLGCY